MLKNKKKNEMQIQIAHVVCILWKIGSNYNQIRKLSLRIIRKVIYNKLRFASNVL